MQALFSTKINVTSLTYTVDASASSEATGLEVDKTAAPQQPVSCTPSSSQFRVIVTLVPVTLSLAPVCVPRIVRSSCNAHEWSQRGNTHGRQKHQIRTVLTDQDGSRFGLVKFITLGHVTLQQTGNTKDLALSRQWLDLRQSKILFCVEFDTSIELVPTAIYGMLETAGFVLLSVSLIRVPLLQTIAEWHWHSLHGLRGDLV